jgi:hypothetical protein
MTLPSFPCPVESSSESSSIANRLFLIFLEVSVELALRCWTLLIEECADVEILFATHIGVPLGIDLCDEVVLCDKLADPAGRADLLTFLLPKNDDCIIFKTRGAL